MNNFFTVRYTIKCVLILFTVLVSQSDVFAQNPFAGLESLFTEPKSYTLYRAATPVNIDGELQEKSWLESPWTSYFVDIEGGLKPSPAYKTRVKMLWDENYLYVAAEMEEPHLWANPQPEKDIIFRDNVFKIFIDPDNNVNDDFEIQINPQNKMLFLIMNKPYRDSGTPVTGWNPIGYKSSVKLLGTMNNSGDTDQGWVAEIAIPLAALKFDPLNTKQNTNLRINFLRTNFDFTVRDGVYAKAVDANGKALPPHYSCFTPQGIINMHYPERWAYTVFSDKAPNLKAENFSLPYSEKQRKYLWLVYYRQKELFKLNKKYAANLKDLNIQESGIVIDGKRNVLTMEANSKQFLVLIREEGNASSISVDHDGQIIY
jgi:hypothetical protein